MTAWVGIAESIGAGGGGAALTYFGNRYVARSSRRAAQVTNQATAQVENRKVDLDEFREFKITYREELTAMGKRVRAAETQTDHTMRVLQEAINHIDDLRQTMTRAGLTPIALPEILKSARWEAFTRRPYSENGTQNSEASE